MWLSKTDGKLLYSPTMDNCEFVDDQEIRINAASSEISNLDRRGFYNKLPYADGETFLLNDNYGQNLVNIYHGEWRW